MLNFYKHKKLSLKRSKKRLIYSRAKLINPLFKRKKIKFNLPHFSFSRRAKLIILEIIVLTIGLIWFFFFTSVFSINSVIVNGIEKLSKKEIENFAWQQIDRSWMKQNNLWLFNRKTLIKKLNEKYAFDSMAIKKNFPDSLVIYLKEKQIAVIWHENDQYFYLDSQSNIIEQVELLSIKHNLYSLIDNLGEKKIIDKKIDFLPNKIQFIVELFKKLKDLDLGLNIDRFVLEQEENTVKLILFTGPSILFNFSEDLNQQLGKLSVIKQRLKDDFSKKVYLDLRYGDRVYYR